MIRLFALLILWSLPWCWNHAASVARLRVDDYGGPQCIDDNVIVVAHYDPYHETIHLCPGQSSHLRHAIIHESQHHMQLVENVALWPGGYAAFERAALYEIDQGDYSPGVRATVHALADMEDRFPTYNELHAELPWVLNMNVPDSLQAWYPWFE